MHAADAIAAKVEWKFDNHSFRLFHIEPPQSHNQMKPWIDTNRQNEGAHMHTIEQKKFSGVSAYVYI